MTSIPSIYEEWTTEKIFTSYSALPSFIQLTLSDLFFDESYGVPRQSCYRSQCRRVSLTVMDSIHMVCCLRNSSLLIPLKIFLTLFPRRLTGSLAISQVDVSKSIALVGRAKR